MHQGLTDDSSTANKERLGVGHLVGLTTTIAISLVTVQLVRRLRLPADNWYLGVTETTISAGDTILAFVYGTGIALSIFAVRTRRIWDNPGKIIAIILGSAFVIHWGLDLATACLMAIRFDVPLDGSENYVRGGADARGFLFGTWYRNVSTYFGYLFVLPVVVYIFIRTRNRRSVWTFVWLALLAFVIASIGRLYFSWHFWLPASVREYYFAVSIALPCLAIVVAFLCDLVFCRERLDWWTNSAIAVSTIGMVVIAANSLMR